MLEFAKPWPIVAQSLPAIKREVLKLHRDYVSSVIYTLVGEPFNEWAKAGIKARNDKMEAEKDMVAHLDPEIAALLDKSTSVCSKYSYHKYGLTRIILNLNLFECRHQRYFE